MIEYLREELLNQVQKEVDGLGVGGLKGKISDGYHTFDELYEHRCALYIALCKLAEKDNKLIWRSKKHSDGSDLEGWFLLGINITKGEQITYHLPTRFWDSCEFAYTKEKAPDFDGHTPQDVIKRLKSL